MASLAECSLASVPIANLVQLEQQLLQAGYAVRDPSQPQSGSEQRRSEPGPDSNDKDDTNAARTMNATDDNASAVIPDSADAYRTPYTSPSIRPPRLSASRSAPQAEMEAMVQQPPRQALMAMSRAESFPGFAGGDTQPMESQVYRDYTESMAAKSSRTTTTPPKEKTMIYISPDGKYNTYHTSVERTPKTCGEGETGFIDLANAWQRSGSQGAKSTTSDLDELLASPETQLHVTTGVQDALLPETPSVAGHKRRRSDEAPTSAVTSAKKTPGYSQLFGGGFKAPTMGATQLFDQTQAPSSPLPDGPRSDPILTRPSPNITHRLSLSSPAATMSSPVVTMHGRLPSSTAGEPRDNYTSMRESQERRRAQLRAEMSLPSINDDDEDDEDDEQPLNRQRRIRRARSDEDFGNWAKLTAPSRADSRPSSSRLESTTIDLVTPATMRKGERVEFTISDDEDDQEVDEHMDEGDAELPLHDEDRDSHSVDGQDMEDDVYDELGQTVLQSQPDYTIHDDERDDDKVNDLEEDDPQKDDIDQEDVSMVDAHPPQHETRRHNEESSTADAGRAVTATQRSAIADSQPLGQPQIISVPQKISHRHSPMSSFVPGSQYAGKTSQELAHVRASSLRNSTASQVQGSEKLPSSPPLPAVSNTIPEGSAEASLAHRVILAEFRPHSQPELAYRPEPEIPESDALASDAARPMTAHSVALTAHGETNSLPAPFSTARTHLSASGNPSPMKSPLKAFASQLSAIASPRGLAGVRRFTDIAADPTPPNGSGETELDVDALMDDVMTAEDREFIEAVSSPVSEKANKRRKLTHRAERSVTPMMAAQRALRKPTVEPTDAIQTATAREEDPETPKAHRTLQSAAMTADECRNPGQILQSSLSKANELPASTPENALPPKGTQESVKRREEAGANAVSTLLSTRSARSVKPPARLAGVSRKSSTAKADTEVPGKVSTKGKGAKLKSEPTLAVDATTSRRKSRLGSRRRDSPLAVIETEQTDAPNEQQEPVNISIDPEAVVENVEGDELAITAPTRVLALFKGTFNMFYPATWLSSSYDGKSHKVRFDDTTVTNIETHQICSLDLRVGDCVKVDAPGRRNKVWTVQGFGGIASEEARGASGSDVYGRTVVKVSAKGGRSSLSAPNELGEGEVQDVAISDIYITATQWPAFNQRTFHPTETAVGKRENSGYATPSTGLRTPDAETTPGSRTRRALSTLPTAVSKRMSHLREESVASFTGHGGGAGLFNGMAFAISYVSNYDTEKVEVTRLIQRNGGTILESGFDELFDLPSLDEAASPHKRAKAAVDESAESSPSALRLKPEHAHLGFVALIADRHSRRAKYMQALALGLPTLSGRWIVDSLHTTTTTNTASYLLPWTNYLLAAGESAYLSGAIRSRSLAQYTAAEAALADTITRCEKLLRGDGVLIVAARGGKSQAAWEKRKAYAFLTMALGAGRVRRVADLAEVKALVGNNGGSGSGSGESGGWKWVYVDGSVSDASNTLFGRSGAKKRKREEEGRGKGGASKPMSATSGCGNVRIVNDEFVVQSLILGALVD